MTTFSDKHINLESPSVIVSYLKGEASQEVSQEIDARIEADDAYALLVQEWDQNLMHMGDDALLRVSTTQSAIREALEGLQPPLDKPDHKVIKPFWRKPAFISMAATLAALIGFTFWNMGTSSDLSPRRLALQEMEAFAPRIGSRGSAEEQLVAIQAAYQEGREDEAITLIIPLLETDSIALAPVTRVELTLALANYNLRQEIPDMARTRLEAIEAFPEKRQEAEAYWILALADLYEANIPSTRRNLEKVQQTGIPAFVKKAEALMDELPE